MKEITIEEKGCAKINLALHVTGVKEDGYHILDSIVIFTDIFDILSFKKDKKNIKILIKSLIIIKLNAASAQNQCDL